MANDISLGERSPVQRPRPGIVAFCAGLGPELGQAVALAVGNKKAAQRSFNQALARAARQWNRIDTDAAAWIFGTALSQVERTVDADLVASGRIHDFPLEGRGMQQAQLAASVSALPMTQRSVLVATHFSRWTERETAAGLGVPEQTIATRHRRAVGFLCQRHGVTPDVLVPALEEYFLREAEGATLTLPDGAGLVRMARRRSLRNRLAIGVLGVALIGAAATLVAVDRPATSFADGPVPEPTVAPPTTSSQWFGPVSDGSGGFIALNTSSGALFSRSTDGTDWYREALWNSRAVDIRTVVTSFSQSGGQYLAALEPAGATRQFVAPRIASSRNLEDWLVLDVDVGELPEIEGLLPSARILGMAAAGNRQLVAIRIEDTIDYRAHDVRARDVCVVANDERGITLHLCDGSDIEVASPSSRAVAGFDNRNRLFLSEAGQPFTEIDAPREFNPFGLFSFGGRFGLLDDTTTQLVESIDGRDWDPLFAIESESRFGLAAGSLAGGAMIVNPQGDGWESHLIDDGEVASGVLPVEMNPAAVWLKPQIASGPAGWAMFVTASRPWERAGNENPGWAVDTGEWIVSHLPGTETYSVQSRDGATSYRYAPSGRVSSRDVDETRLAQSFFGGVQLFHPVTGDLLVEVDENQIAASRGGFGDAPSGSVELDGWKLEGNVETGPLEVTPPGGQTATYGDGYAFLNGQIGDGVELEIAQDETGASIRFLSELAGPSGELVVPIAELRNELATQAPSSTTPGDPPVASVLFSTDGIEWRVIWESVDDTWYGTIAVGDSEVLLSASQLTGGPIRIPLDR